MRIIPSLVKAKVAQVARQGLGWRRVFVSFVASHPILLIPLSVAYGFTKFVVAFISLFLGLGVAWAITRIFSIDPEELFAISFFFAKAFFVLLAPLVWVDYLYLAFRCFTSTAILKGYAAPILRVVQLVGATVFIFAVAHYYVALFSDDEAYHGLLRPAPEGGWRYGGFEDRLLFRPSIDTVMDCIYFSTITTATVGYGDIFPVSRAAKIVTIIQIIFSFGLIVVVLGWVIGHAKDEA